MPDHQSSVGSNPRFLRAVNELADCVNAGSLDTAWRAFTDLRELELVLGRSVVQDELHRRLPSKQLYLILRSILPDFAPTNPPLNVEAAARHVYMFTKLLNYLLLISRLHKGERNEVAVLRLTMGQCMRRLLDMRFIRTTTEAKKLVGLWEKISKSSSLSLQLTTFDIYMLVLGAWKSGRHLLVPYLYRMACKQWRVSDEARFQRLSALVLSFYVREYGSSIEPAVIRGLLMDLNERSIKLLPHHYAMLILYFGRTQNLDEALQVFEQAMKDPNFQSAEAIYYNLFRAFGDAFKLRRRGGWSGKVNRSSNSGSVISSMNSQGASCDAYSQDNSGDNDYFDGLDENIQGFNGDYEQPDPAPNLGTKYNSDQHQAAKICMLIFQRMTTSSVSIGFRTYRELINCMIQFDMQDKAQRIFTFAMDTMKGKEIKAHFIIFYLRLIAPTPYQQHLELRKIMDEDENVTMAMSTLTKRQLVDQFGIFDGNLQAFFNRTKRPASTERGGEFLSHYIFCMFKANRAAEFIRHMLAGNDPNGVFSGYNFPKLKYDSSGLAAIEGEVEETCQWIQKHKRGWLRHCDVIYNLIPILPGIAGGTEPKSDDVQFIRQLVNGCRDVGQFIAQLDGARVEGYGVDIVNLFMRVKFLGLTFQRYAREKTAGGRRLFWPSFMYINSNTPVSLSGDGPLLSISRDVYSREIAHMLPMAKASWAQLVEIFCADPSSGIAPNADTLSIFSRIAIFAEDWAFGQRVWDDAFRLMGRRATTDAGENQLLPSAALPLQCVRIYECYLQFIALSTLAGLRELGHSPVSPGLRDSQEQQQQVRQGKVVFGEGALVDMLELMDRNGVGVTSGLLCQGVAAAFQVGQIDIGGVLEQWQLHRERHGLARAGFMQQYFASNGLPEVPDEPASVLELVRGSAGCPRLMRLISLRTQRSQ
ncbi:hypothetical protein COEREDRAFT_85745 [Coemansia reversa NRRL 1564]|uniref:Uncharacterized protein n=1 Tax=Coemansia reversa (strain ATCC 12441 / NRRL 1564) TaxID=763665 RepID=A0A2G5BFT8_COERN|nr:hypothetical protein COEREDRAFT_85745 [Coemansia reversa NRRL 1564]|eukprot:PIA17861.1 hypothetical protein COEREDRAFT_85745 [Coemansia reversa NRRL 1564]